MPMIIGERVVLREYRESDLPCMRKWVNDPDIVDNLSHIFLYPHSMRDTEQFLNMMMAGNSDTRGFVIADKETESYYGQIDLFGHNQVSRSAEMGIVIGVKDELGKGIGSEAIRLLQQFVFDRLNLNRLELKVHDYNKRAIRCYQKCGFVEEGRLRQAFFIHGHYTDMLYMSILRDEYRRKVKDNERSTYFNLS
ncbi:GNAT family N-acetyltransferase [Paenibacillus sp. 1001270B_150601_E10]|uniref:GNAT family N-acetyltransferase n=1 Tax=Paenibacillus sp. 1001270B_150601_E10 TaxID=2787079 RepID=UPI00189D0D91|nr:GNAT family protein [Paenibacillus sp. 1001270B_150601_E10]